MKGTIVLRYRRALVLFVLILLLFSLVANGLLIAQQRSVMLNQSKQNIERELRLMSVLVRESLLQRKYANVEEFLTRWAKEDHEVIQLTATSANGFQLVNYQRAKDSIHKFNTEYQVNMDGAQLLHLKMVWDFSSIEESLTSTRVHLLLGTLVFMLLLGRFLWVSVQKMALIPMERIESELRKQQYRLRRLTSQKDKEIARVEERLVQEVRLRKKFEQVSEQRAQRLVVLQELEHRILNADSIAGIAELALGHVRSFVSCQHALLLLFDEAREQAMLVAECKPDSVVSLPGEYYSLQGFAGLPVLERGDHYRVADLSELKSQSGLDDLLFARKIHSYLSIPLRGRERLLGAIILGSESGMSCAGENLESSTEIAELIAIALQDPRIKSAP